MGRLKDRYNKTPVVNWAEELEEQNGEEDTTKEVKVSDSPIELLDEIKENRSQKGTLPVNIQGEVYDLFDFEDYILRISPYNIKTLMRYHSAKTISHLKGYDKHMDKMMRKRR